MPQTDTAVRVLALDYGSARCGCAVSDPTGVLATPLEPVLRPTSRPGLRRIVELVDELQAKKVLIGLPLGLSGSDTAQTKETRSFAKSLGKLIDVPIELYDERFTTRLAQRDGDGSGFGVRASEDSRAAAHLLSSFLERRDG